LDQRREKRRRSLGKEFEEEVPRNPLKSKQGADQLGARLAPMYA
jgi:hypothetical protein